MKLTLPNILIKLALGLLISVSILSYNLAERLRITIDQLTIH
jgi:hypothetical protein